MDGYLQLAIRLEMLSVWFATGHAVEQHLTHSKAINNELILFMFSQRTKKAKESGGDYGKLTCLAHAKGRVLCNSRSLLPCGNMGLVLSNLLISKDKLETQNFM